MKAKDIEVGEYYILASNKKSRMACSAEYFTKLRNQEVLVLTKLNNFNNNNTIQIQGICKTDKHFELVSFWCSPYDLKERRTDES
jgi:hypothetical protein